MRSILASAIAASLEGPNKALDSLMSPRIARPVIDLHEARQSLRSLRDWLRLGVSYLSGRDVSQTIEQNVNMKTSLSFGQGAANAHGETLQVLCWATKLSPQALVEHLDARLMPSEALAVAGIFEARKTSGQPMAYLLGEAWFRELRFLADPRALVPRSLILEALEQTLWTSLEELSPTFLERLSQQKSAVLDLCTGGGSIAIQAASKLPHAELVATDLSAQALGLAQQNLDLHEMQERIALLEGNLFGALKKNKGLPIPRKFDLILSNPPYVNTVSMQALPREFRAEPELALAGGADGMDIVREIIMQAPKFMHSESFLLIEIGHEADFFEAAFPWLSFNYVPVTVGDNMLVLMSKAELVDHAKLLR